MIRSLSIVDTGAAPILALAVSAVLPPAGWAAGDAAAGPGGDVESDAALVKELKAAR
jgi:hypothetical protein